ncbi:MAG: hypothetical protein HY815_27185 [Candidatus Riflebacteria bacterium]|nr:hypothetical protein [Candidatus Riflebacteria bacterium]
MDDAFLRWRAFPAPLPPPAFPAARLSWSARGALILVKRLAGRFGRVCLAEVLAGEASDKVLTHGLNWDPAFGLLRGGGRGAAFGTLRDLEKRGLIQVVMLEGTYPVLGVTDAGRAALL